MVTRSNTRWNLGDNPDTTKVLLRYSSWGGSSAAALPPEGFAKKQDRTIARVAAIGALVAAVVLVGVLMFGGSGGYTVSATFQNAGQLVKGNYVQVAGRPVGKIKEIALDDNGQARVEMTVGSGF